MKDLEEKLREAANARFRLIATDGVFSMDGTVAPLAEICDLAEAHEAMVMVDDSHAVGFYGPTGRGTPEACGVIGRIDVLTGTLGKALGGASGGYTSARREIVELLRQRSRPYLFSNTLAPTIVSASLRAFTLLEENQQLLEALAENTAYFRRKLADVGFDIPAGDHPIVPIMLGDAKRAVRYAERLLALGVYVIAFSYPVVPKGTARIRTQVSAAHSKADLDYTVEKFAQVRDEIEGST
jgi:glycine C-acetyltransferase